MTLPTPLFKNYQDTLIPACLLWMAGLLAGMTCLHHPLFWGVWSGLSLAGGLATLGLAANYRSVTRWYLWLLCFCLAGLAGSLQPTEPPASDISHLGEVSGLSVQGELISTGNSPEKWVFHVTQADSKPVSGQVMLTIPAKQAPTSPLHIGDTLNLTGKLSQPFAPVFPGQFDYKAYLATQDISALFKAESVSVESTQPTSRWLSLLRWAEGIRLRVVHHFQAHLPPIEAQILGSIVLGEHAVGVDTDVKNAFRQAGLIHLLAASGLNVGLIGAFFLAIGRLIRLPLRLSLALAMLGAGAYCLLTGLPPSVQRAGMMLEIAFLLKFFRRELTPITLICLAGVALTWMNPKVLTMLGFQLSFLSTFGLIAMVSPLQEKIGYYITDEVAGLLLVPIVAQLWVTPLLLYHFSQVQLLAVPANIIAVPLVIVLSYMGFVLGGISLFLPQLSGWFLTAFGFIVTTLRELAEWMGNLPLAVQTVASPPLPLILLMFLILFFGCYALHQDYLPRFKPLALATVSLLLVFLIPLSLTRWHEQHHWETTWLPTDYGQSGIEITRTPEGHVMVTAAGLNYWGSRDLVAYLKKQGARQIDLIILANPHIKSLSGLETVLQTMPVKQIVTAPLSSAKLNRTLLTLAVANGSEVIPLTGNDKLKAGAVEGNLMSLSGQGETLLRWNWQGRCLASHWGPAALENGSLKPLTEGCLWIQDKTTGHLRNISLGNTTGLPHIEDRFSKVIASNRQAQLQY